MKKKGRKKKKASAGLSGGFGGSDGGGNDESSDDAIPACFGGTNEECRQAIEEWQDDQENSEEESEDTTDAGQERLDAALSHQGGYDSESNAAADPINSSSKGFGEEEAEEAFSNLNERQQGRQTDAGHFDDTGDANPSATLPTDPDTGEVIGDGSDDQFVVENETDENVMFNTATGASTTVDNPDEIPDGSDSSGSSASTESSSSSSAAVGSHLDDFSQGEMAAAAVGLVLLLRILGVI